MDLKRFLKTMRLIFICHSGSFLTFQPGFATDPEYGGQPTFFNIVKSPSWLSVENSCKNRHYEEIIVILNRYLV